MKKQVQINDPLGWPPAGLEPCRAIEAETPEAPGTDPPPGSGADTPALPALSEARLSRRAWLASASLAACALAGAGAWALRAGRPYGQARAADSAEHPRHLPALAPRLFGPASREAAVAAAALAAPPVAPLRGPVLCHLLRAYGRGPIGRADLASGCEALRLLTDAPPVPGRPGGGLAFATRDGVRYRMPPPGGSGAPGAPEVPGADGESHRDLFLATFAELGLPLSTPLRTVTGTFALRDALRDSLACFDLAQQELAWTATAYALYLPPGPWLNRDGATFTFDGLALELVRRPLAHACCGGTHVLYALAALTRADAGSGLLSPKARRAVESRLRACAEAAAGAQRPDGAWPVAWHPAELAAVSADTRDAGGVDMELLIAGHLVEWMQRLPAGLQPDAALYRRAAGWLCGRLETLPPPADSARVCPWTHAVCAVRNLVAAGEHSSTTESPGIVPG